MTERRDQDLEQLFAKARAHDEQRAPSLLRIVTLRREPPRVPHTGLVMALATVILAAIAFWQYATPDEPRLDIAFTPGDMSVPTDYLLDMMSFPRAGEVPQIGAAEWYPLPMPDNAALETRRTP